MHPIPPHTLWLGTTGDLHNVRPLHEIGIQAIVQLAYEESLPELPRELIVCRFPLLDGEDNPPGTLRLAIDSVTHLLHAKFATLVCCQAGSSRSPAIAAAALARLTNQAFATCVAEIAACRPIAIHARLAAAVQALRRKILLRDVQPSDPPIFFEHQREPEGNRMAAFPARGYDEFMAHWAKCLAITTSTHKTIVVDGAIVGNIVAWRQDDQTKVGYWLGKDHWGKGIASTALAQFVALIPTRPLHAHVAKHNVASIRVLQKCGFTIVSEETFQRSDREIGAEYLLTLS